MGNVELRSQFLRAFCRATHHANQPPTLDLRQRLGVELCNHPATNDAKSNVLHVPGILKAEPPASQSGKEAVRLAPTRWLPFYEGVSLHSRPFRLSDLIHGELRSNG